MNREKKIMKHLFQVFLFPYLMLASLAMGSQPTINTIEPFVGPSEGDNVVIMTGTNFTEDMIINFGSIPAHLTMVLSDTIISAVVPPGVPGTVAINMTRSNESYPSNCPYTYQGKAIIPDPSPVALFTATIGMPGTLCSFDASSSHSPIGSISLYEWDFGDGTTKTTPDPYTEHCYASSGYFCVKLKVTNSQGTSTEKQFIGPLLEKNGGTLAMAIKPIQVSDPKSPELACNFVVTAVTASQNPVCVGVPVSFSAVISNFTPTSTPGTLSYFIDLVLINTVNVNTLGVAPDSNSITASPGLHLVYASYNGDDVNCSFPGNPILFTVNATAINASADPNPICEGQSTTFSATDFPTGATGTTTFSIGSTTLCTATLPATSCTASISAAGSQTVTATYSGDSNNCGGSTTFPLNVRTLTTTTASANPNPVGEGQSVTLSATVASSGPTPTGTVTFSIGSTLLCTASLSGGTGACISSAIPVGTQIITATYNGDVNNCPSNTTYTLVVRPFVRNARVVQCVDCFATQSDRVNILTWKAPHHFEAVIYKIYRDAELRELIGVVHVDHHEDSFRFEDHNRKKNHIYRYFIIGVDAFGNETCPSEVVLG